MAQHDELTASLGQAYAQGGPSDQSSEAEDAKSHSSSFKAEQPETTGRDVHDQLGATENPTAGHYEDEEVPTYSAAEMLSLPREIAFVAVICLAQFTTQIGLGQTLSILHVLGNHLGVTEPGELNNGKLAWITAGYSLTVGSFILISGRLGDFYGYKKMLLIGFTWFAVWSLVAGLSVYIAEERRFLLFVFARVLQGIGPSICLPNGLAILGATYPPGKRKNIVFSFFAASAPCGSITGAAFAGLFTLAWWPWTFFTFALALTLIALLGTISIPNIPRKHRGLSLRQTLIQLDLLGGTIGITSLILINFAWNQAPIAGWSEPYVYSTLIIGIALIPAFIYTELRISPLPLIPLKALLDPDVAFVLICLACGWSSFGIWFYYTFQTFLLLRGQHNNNGTPGSSPLQATAMMVPEAVSGAIAAVVTGYLLSHLRAAWVMTLALTAFTLGTVLMCTAPVEQTYWGQTFFATIVIAWGMDMSFPAATVILSNAVDREFQGIGASLVNTVVNYSISIGLGFAGTVEVHVNTGGQTREELLRGFRGAWYMGLGFAGAGLVVSLLFLARSYRRPKRAI